MRPVLLEMEGFASFRERAVVDFEEADYFAIVGPTGSGKSTLVDAMTFALFGSAPRWGRKNAVSMALSPHGNRAVVRLVFELAGERYVVAREVRRTGASITAKNQRLERLPSLQSRGEPDEVTHSIAADSKVTEAVEKLLGLTFEQFRQCVVLPQNAFAEFLHSTPSNRQQILLRLIGAEHYDKIQQRANEKAAQAQDRVQHLDRALGDLADATPEAEASALAREQQLEGLVTEVRAALPGLASAQEALAEALRLEDRLGGERNVLAAIAVPAGVSEIDQAWADARSSSEAAAQAETTAEAADTAAREQLSSAPARGPLEQAVKDHTELARLTADHPALVAATDTSQRTHESAGHTVTAAELRQAQAQAAAERASRTAEEVRRQVAELEAQHHLLSRPTLPSGLDELDRDLTTARADLEAAQAVLAEAETADEAATTALSSGPPRGPLERARAMLEEAASLEERLAELEVRVSAAQKEAQEAASLVGTQNVAVQDARHRRDEVQLRHAALNLRGHLVAGEDCPVCAQVVTELPAVPGSEVASSSDLANSGAERELAVADAAIAAAEAELERARALLNRVARAESVAESNVESTRRRIEELRGSLPRACPDLATADRLLGELEALEAAQRQASVLVRQARAKADAARSRVEQLAATEARIRSGLGQTRDPLVALGAPAVENLSLAEAWRTLIEWAGERAGALASELGAARESRATADAQLQLASKELAESEAALRAARTVQQQALAEVERARAALAQAERRIAELGSALNSAVALEEAQAQLENIAHLEAAARQTDVALREARRGREKARQQLASLEGRLTEGWATLRRTRDSVVHLGAPELEGNGVWGSVANSGSADGSAESEGDSGRNTEAATAGLAPVAAQAAAAGPDTARASAGPAPQDPRPPGSLLGGWNVLTAWSSAAAREREEALVSARAATSARREQSESARGELTDVLKQHAIEVTGDDLATSALAAATGAYAEARGTLARVRERREQAAQVVSERAAEERSAQVAKLLGELLRSTGFPRWLATAALESLVIEASDTLRQLSNGQFDLDHDDKGELVVVDHTDADARRSVKTLSGGETFQASLAMALALSSQMSQLSSAGGARLDSIFLDEGFGTLDPDTLETVAGTLENLARGERMVGVITHVPALADRVPVRFNVRRDAQTSRVERQNL
ncbi:hypothetical protein Kisp01_51950 [Kineosporia sp. NBRC 101677]|uniref:AAA family ATPase n=1 Tax=Kineosporia sp. NBRC 101677 TaxID=3032197 RepID=UPI0024A12004|nr:SMC family ATPase [Kineosporia sp. NBRC 101677]GLY18181.1 hypothetical protein Kisp01_51950 [Kineosporia sp. NBRC 101677]